RPPPPRPARRHAVRGDPADLPDAGPAVGEVAEQPAHVLHGGGPGHCSFSFGTGAPAAASALPAVRPRCTPRWYAERRPRTSSGLRRFWFLGPPSTPPGTSCAWGTRL